jgi:uncharacterized hydrophobic protein (TIGR00271 family)
MFQGPMDERDIARIEHALFFEPPEMRQRYIRFVMLILFASVIASGGLLSDSVASVIGAMIVAPLMTPIMGMVVAIVIGSRQRLLRASLTVLMGIGLAITVGWLMATLMPYGWDPGASGQIIARTSPRLLDLIVALASGGAGAYALSRVDVADALPGVAIAISLVPPLNTAGILLAAGERELAVNALVLFMTNFGAILLAGTITFILTGLARGTGRAPREIRTAMLAIFGFVALIALPLVANGNAIWTEARREDQIREIISTWLADSTWELYEVTVEDKHVSLILGGEGELPPSEDVLATLRSEIGEDIRIDVRVLTVRKETLTTAEPIP